MDEMPEESSQQPSRDTTPSELSRLAELAAAGRYRELEKEAHELLAQLPAEGLVWKMLATSLWMQGKDALQALQRVAQLLADDAEAHSNLGTALRAHGRLDDAVRCYLRALEIRPDFAGGHSNLGGALFDLARFDEAVECYHRAIAIQPNIAVFNSNLGDALRARGQLHEAVPCYRRALELDPNFFEAHEGLGKTMQDLGQLDQALASYRHALALRPDSTFAHTNLGDGYLAIGRMNEAEASYRHALALDPLHAEAHNGLAGALRMQNRAAEAEASCRRALEIKPNFALASVCLALFESENGRFAQAEDLLKKAIAIEPDSPDVWASIPGLRKMTSGDAGWLTEAQRITNRPLPPRREANLRYAIGKYFDDLSEFDQAFANYRRANDLSRLHGRKHDRDEVAREFDQAIECYSRDWIARRRIEANASELPVFIVGMPRSGTTLSEQIIASHPAVFGAGELSNWVPVSTRYVSTPLSEEQSENVIRKLGGDYLRLLREQSVDALRVVDKTPGNFRCIGLIHAALPDARIIHMRRNPIDTCLSIYFQDFHMAHSYANDLEDLAHYYRQYLRLMEHWRSTIPEKSILEVPYEGLTHDQEAWSRRMLEFVGLPWDPRCLDFHSTKRRIITFSKWEARQVISKSSVARWRNYEKFLGPLLSLVKPGPEALKEA
jgi:tetratricopeptide (TPR) repeat protein